MQKKTQTLKGFRDFPPVLMRLRNQAISHIREVFEKYGFEELQTPALEYQEVLLGKYGEEAEKLMYLFEDPGGRSVGLRYDLTVPLARYMAQNQATPMPLKRYQIQPVWRAEKPQKGRYREFFQCDVDTIGSSSPISDAEILAIIWEIASSAFNFPGFEIKIGSRPVLFSSMEKAGIAPKDWPTGIQSIDKLDKKTHEAVKQELATKGFKKEQIQDVFAAIARANPDKYLQEVMTLAQKMGVMNLVFSPNLARGLDYYTGPIFETVVTEPKIGSITGGGRYDKLLESLGGPDLPAVGTTIGLDRVVDVINELKLWEDIPSTVLGLVAVFDAKLSADAVTIAGILRAAGINTTIFPSYTTKLKKQLKYADKLNIPWVFIVGPDEAEKNQVTIKNLKTGVQETVARQELVDKVQTSS